MGGVKNNTRRLYLGWRAADFVGAVGTAGPVRQGAPLAELVVSGACMCVLVCVCPSWWWGGRNCPQTSPFWLPTHEHTQYTQVHTAHPTNTPRKDPSGVLFNPPRWGCAVAVCGVLKVSLLPFHCSQMGVSYNNSPVFTLIPQDAKLHRITQNYTELHRVTRNHTELCKLQKIAQNYTESHKSTKNYTILHQMTHNNTKVHKITLCNTELHGVTLNNTELHNKIKIVTSVMGWYMLWST